MRGADVMMERSIIKPLVGLSALTRVDLLGQHYIFIANAKR